MNDLVYLGAAPFYAMAVWACWFGMSYSAHMLRRVDQSATETAATETVEKPTQ